MTQNELIGKIKELRQIKPSQEWVFLTKSRVLGEEAKLRGIWYYLKEYKGLEDNKGWLGSGWLGGLSPLRLRPAYAGLISVLVILGLFGFAQNSVPGDYLYPIKKIAERSQTFFVSEKEAPNVSLELASRRLEELSKIVEANQTKKLAPAINEFQATVSEATRNLSRVDATSTDAVAVKKLVDQAKNIERKAQEIKALGVAIEEGDLVEASSKLELELLVKVLGDVMVDLENRTLTEKQEAILAEMKELVAGGKYSQALELYLINQ